MTKAVNLFVLASFVTACCAKAPRLPRPGETLRAEAFSLEPGGKGFNVAAAARRLGAEVDGLIGVGSDLFGEFAERSIAAAGLAPAMVTRHPGPTGAGIGFIDPQGENCIAVFPGANSLLGASDVDAARERLVTADAVVAQFEIEDPPIARAFALARAFGVTTILNPSPYRPLRSDILQTTDILVLNEAEADQACRSLGLAAPAGPHRDGPQPWRPLVDALLDQGVQAVALTQGARGALAARRGHDWVRQPAFPIAPVDTIGAGDSFLAGLVVSLCEGRGWPDSLQRAAACGALVASADGVLAALPTADRLERFMAASRGTPA
jgi:ribokinase